MLLADADTFYSNSGASAVKIISAPAPAADFKESPNIFVATTFATKLSFSYRLKG